MADITKRVSDCDDDCEGERGKRGRRGHRGHRGPPGSSSSLLGPTEGPGSLEADEDIPAGFVITAGGSARLALADGSSRGNAIGVSTGTVVASQVVEYVFVGLVVLGIELWDAVTSGSGGLIEGDAYYLSQTTPGRMINIRPTSGQIVHVGTAISTTALDVQIDGFQTAPEAGPSFTTWALKWSITQQPPGFGPSSLSDDATGVGVRIGSTDFKYSRQYAFPSPHKAASVALRTQNGGGGSGTIRLKKNGAVFASFPTPPANSTALHPLSQPFAAGDNIEVVLESLDIISITVVVEFQEPAAIGAPGPIGPTGPAGPSAPGPTTEHVAFGLIGGALDPATDVSFVTFTGLLPDAPTVVPVTLPDGTVDGRQKVVTFDDNTNITWTLTPTNFQGGNTTISFATGAGGGVLLVWDESSGAWWLVSTEGGTTS